MYDNDMTNILKNFAGAGSGSVTDAKTGKAKVNTAAQEKNAMKLLLEGLDAQQKSVNQMPAPHTMAKNTGTKHPASKFLVGGRYEDEGPDFYDGQQVELKPAYADNPGEVFTLSNWDGRRGWVGDAQGRGWGVSADQIMPAENEDENNYSEGTEVDDTCPNCGAPGWNDDEGDALCKACGHNTYDDFDDESMDYDYDPDDPDSEDMLGRPRFESASNEAPIQPGVNVHIGHHVAGGSGIEGEVVRIEDDIVVIRNPEGKMYKGQLKNTTVSEGTVEEDTVNEVQRGIPGKPGWEPAVARAKEQMADMQKKGKSDKYIVGMLYNTMQSVSAKNMPLLFKAIGLRDQSSEGYYFLQAGIDRHPVKFETEKEAVKTGNRLFGKYRMAVIRVKYKAPGEKAVLVKTLKLNEEDTYEDTIAQRTPPKTQMNKKQSFKDIFQSMDETEEELAGRFKKELHDEREERALKKGTNGKFDLAERFHDGEELSWGDELLEDLKGLLHDAESYEDMRDGVLSLIQQYEQE